MPILGFDIEVSTILQDFSQWKEHRPIGISCAATHESDGATRLWHGSTGSDGRFPSRMSELDCRRLVEYLAAQEEHGYQIVTWNGLAFDFDVLAEETGSATMAAKVADLALGHVDIGFAMLCDKGYMVALDTAARALGLSGKTAGMSGAKAPVMWAGNRASQERVLEYVGQDARVTVKVYQAIASRGKLEWTSSSGRTAWWSVPGPRGQIPDVSLAYCRPEPNTSWMTGGPRMTREDAIRWAKHHLEF